MFKNYEFKIYKIKNNFQIKNKYNNNYIKNFIENEKNLKYKYEMIYNLKFKKFLYYNNKNKKYSNYFYVMINNENNNNEFKKDLKFYSLFKSNKIKFIETYIKKNFHYLNKFNIIKIENEIFIIEKKLFK